METTLPNCRDNVRVVVRIRPQNEEELRDHVIVTQALSDQMLVFDPKRHRSLGALPTKSNDVSRRRYKNLKYAFDYVFGPSASNHDIFMHTMERMVQGLVDGYNCSVFAYGATGAGKTHTMLGNKREPGIIYHTMVQLYQKINQMKSDTTFDVSVSYSEVYNEQVRDLLIERGGSLPIREDKTVGVIIAGLTLHKPKTAEQLLHILHFGNENRTQHHTDANAESSRSHAVFQVFLTQKQRGTRVAAELKMAKMCLVDLAGSERAQATTNLGSRFREGANINRSLLALGNVINALTDQKFNGHIPYRDSKLTRLLKDSLGGNCYTVMIAAVSPSSKSYEDTYNTLRYADRAKHIRANIKKNMMSINVHISKTNYKSYVEELERTIQDMRRDKLSLEKRLQQTAAHHRLSVPNIEDFENKLLMLFSTRKEIRRSHMASDCVVRELRWKMSRKEKMMSRVKKLTQSRYVLGKHSRVVERMRRRIEKEEPDLESSARTMRQQEELIQSTYLSAINNCKTDVNGSYVAAVEQQLRLQILEASLQDTTACLGFVKKMALAQERQAVVDERIISALLALVRRQYDVLNSQAPNLLQGDLTERFEECCYLVEERELSGGAVVPETCQSAGQLDVGIIGQVIDIQVPCLKIYGRNSPNLMTQTNEPVDKDPIPLIERTGNPIESFSKISVNGSTANAMSNFPPTTKPATRSINKQQSYHTKQNTKDGTNPVSKPPAKPSSKPTNAVKPAARMPATNGMRTSNDPMVSSEQTRRVVLNNQTRFSHSLVDGTSTQPTKENHTTAQQKINKGSRHSVPTRFSTSADISTARSFESKSDLEQGPHISKVKCLIASSSRSVSNVSSSERLRNNPTCRIPMVSRLRKPEPASRQMPAVVSEEVKEPSTSSDSRTFDVGTPGLPNTPSVDTSIVPEGQQSMPSLDSSIINPRTSSNVGLKNTHTLDNKAREQYHPRAAPSSTESSVDIDKRSNHQASQAPHRMGRTVPRPLPRKHSFINKTLLIKQQ